MSFIVTVYTSEGIIMASDSRTTYNTILMNQQGNKEIYFGTQTTDTTYKTFKCNSRIGISTCGDANINSMPISGYIEKFIVEKVTEKSSVDDISESVRQYFSDVTSQTINTNFIVAGYDIGNLNPIVKKVTLIDGNILTIDTTTPGACWDGEITTLSKLLTQMYSKNNEGMYIPVPKNVINFSFFTLQDAIDFANYAVDVTIKTMAFENCAKTVGGPIDILAIKPDRAFWIARKELHA